MDEASLLVDDSFEEATDTIWKISPLGIGTSLTWSTSPGMIMFHGE